MVVFELELLVGVEKRAVREGGLCCIKKPRSVCASGASAFQGPLPDFCA